MPRSPNQPPSRARHPSLAQDSDAYGHAIPWERLDRCLFRSDGHYVVRGWTNPDGSIELADLARAGVGRPWEMQNDSCDPITAEQWRKLYIPVECDWWCVRGE